MSPRIVKQKFYFFILFSVYLIFFTNACSTVPTIDTALAQAEKAQTPQEKVEHYETALHHWGKDSEHNLSELYRKAGQAHLESNNLEQAELYLHRAILKNQSVDNTEKALQYYLYGKCLYRQQKLKASLKALDMALSLQSQPDYILTKGEILFSASEFQLALIEFKRASLAPSTIQHTAEMWTALSLYSLDRLTEAKTMTADVIATGFENWQTHLLQGLTSQQNNREYFESAVKQSPSEYKALTYSILAQFFWEQRDTAQLNRIIEDALVNDSRNSTAHYFLARAHIYQKKYDLAMANLDNAEKINKNWLAGVSLAHVKMLRGYIAFSKNDYQAAVRWFTEAIDIGLRDSSKDYAIAYYYRSVSHKKTGALANADNDMKKAREFGFSTDLPVKYGFQ